MGVVGFDVFVVGLLVCFCVLIVGVVVRESVVVNKSD